MERLAPEREAAVFDEGGRLPAAYAWYPPLGAQLRLSRGETAASGERLAATLGVELTHDH